METYFYKTFLSASIFIECFRTNLAFCCFHMNSVPSIYGDKLKLIFENKNAINWIIKWEIEDNFPKAKPNWLKRNRKRVHLHIPWKHSMQNVSLFIFYFSETHSKAQMPNQKSKNVGLLKLYFFLWISVFLSKCKTKSK